VEFGILGPLEVRSGSRLLEVGGGRKRALLALLLLCRGEVVSTDRLIEELWGGRAPPTAGKILQGYVSQLRRTLSDDGTTRRLVSRVPGYVLQLEPGELDLDRFESLVERGREALTSGLHQEAAQLLREALALRRGPPLADFGYEPFAQSAIARLKELLLIALEQRIEADLALGRQAELVGELETLADKHPLRERLRGQLMLALYRSGRQAEALEVYQSTRRTLVEELGIDPSPALQQLEQAILRQDVSLELPTVREEPPGESRAEAPPAPAESEPTAATGGAVRRKPVTVLFCDVCDSTGPGEPLDPELLRRVLERYFELVALVLGRHDARVETFAGDAVLAVFGVPDAHEDDALRAVRVAVELRAELSVLNGQFEAELGLTLDMRIGVSSGEVIAGGDPASRRILVTGDVVNRAARLEQAAGASEILLDAATWRLVRNAVRAEPVEQLSEEREAPSVQAVRLLELIEGAPAYARRLDAPLVGREQELAQLRQAFARCRLERTCFLFTLLGTAGIGKSRLAAETQIELGEQAHVLVGRCLPYGDGITFWPLREMLTQAVGNELEQAIERLMASEPEGAQLAGSAAGLLGMGDQSGGGLEDGFLAVRRLLERLATQQPLVLVFEDIHWAESTLLDLIEQLADLARSSPILLLCLARPELLEQRPGWAGGKTNATTILLEQLPESESGRLADWLLVGEGLSAEARAGALRLAEGNPLFLEQLLAFATEDGWTEDDPPLPPTIDALLAARLDRLGPAERALVERAALIGRDFELDALTELAPDTLRPTLPTHLTALVRKELIRDAPSSVPEGQAFRFRHILIRDAAYRGMAKGLRAELHEHYADWLASRYDEHEFSDEIVGYHLEQAYRFRVDLRATGAEADALAQRASERLEAAGTRALGRSDLPAAIGLLERAASLLPDPNPRRARLLADLAATLMDAGRLSDADRVLADAETAAAAAHDTWSQSRVLVERQFLDYHRAAAGAAEEAARIVTRVIPVFERAGDQHGLCRARSLEASSSWAQARTAAAAAAWEQASEHARLAGEEHERAVILCWVASSTWFGPVPVDAGIRRCDEIREDVKGHLASEAETLRPLAGLHGFAGRFDVARSLFAASNAAFDELGLRLNSVLSHPEAVVEILAGNFGVAELRLRSGYETLEAMGEKALRSTTAALLARAIYAQGRSAEAEQFTELSEELAEPSDLLTQIIWRGVRARLIAERGGFDDAESLAREAVTLAERTDLVNFHADALIDLAEVLTAVGRATEASVAVGEALRLYELKGNTVAAGDARARLDALAPA
jgi:DNA-binding SARP family transcriptional activator